MDQGHLIAAARYIELNPVKAGIVTNANDYPWSSAHAHLFGKDDSLVKASSLLEMVKDWKTFLSSEPEPDSVRNILEHARTGRPLGSEEFVSRLEALTGLKLKRKKPGPKENSEN